MRQLLLSFLLITTIFIQAQTTENTDSMMNAMNENEAEPVIATFKSTRVVNSQSVQTLGHNTLDFRIMHRFGTLNNGLYQLFGLDNATMRMSFEYGILDDLMIGLGRSTVGKTYDGFLKYRLLKQSSGGKKNMPISVTLFTSTTYKTLKYNTPRDEYFVGKLDYTSQILIACKFNENLSLQLMPSYVHRNLVETPDQKNDLVSVGIGGRYKFTRRMAVNFDYYFTPQNKLGTIYKNPLSIGVDIETGGHVFQLHITNSSGLVEKQFIGETTGSWLKGDILFGFNLSRVFTLGN